jgi:hypothetical protein
MPPAVVHDLEDRSMFEKVVWWTGKFLDESKRWGERGGLETSGESQK